jgi:hypothetical protein
MIRRALLLLTLAACISPAMALGPAWQLPAGSVDAIGAERMWLFGRRASLRTFDAPGDLADVAAALLAQVSTPARLQAMPDGLLIAGTADDVHWLVRLTEASTARTHGSLSAVDLRHAPALPALAWQPAGTAVRFDVAAEDESVRVRQQVLTDNDPAEAVYRRLCSALPKDGWQPGGANTAMPCRRAPLAWPATEFWQRDEATLTLVVDRHPPGSSVFVMQTEPVTRWRWRVPSQWGTHRTQDRTGNGQ